MDHGSASLARCSVGLQVASCTHLCPIPVVYTPYQPHQHCHVCGLVVWFEVLDGPVDKKACNDLAKRCYVGCPVFFLDVTAFLFCGDTHGLQRSQKIFSFENVIVAYSKHALQLAN